MSFLIKYNQEYKRVIPAVLIDSRVNIPDIVTASGYEVKAYTEEQVALVTSSVIPYKIETNKGNLGGYFLLQVNAANQTAQLINKQLRPAFVNYDTVISTEISNFIISNNWKEDYLF